MQKSRLSFVFMNVGHFLDHLFVLIFATAALRLSSDWGLSYAELIPYATPGFIAFGIGAIPAGWPADKWTREGMMVVFFLGIGSCSILTSMANTPLEMAVCLTLIGLFAAIYHNCGPGDRRAGTGKDRRGPRRQWHIREYGRGQRGVAHGVSGGCDRLEECLHCSRRSIDCDRRALPALRSNGPHGDSDHFGGSCDRDATGPLQKPMLLRILGIILFTTAVGGLVFQSTTFSLPKVFDERLTEIAGSTRLIGSYAFLVFSLAAFAQLVVGYLVDNHSVRTVLAAVTFLQAVFLPGREKVLHAPSAV